MPVYAKTKWRAGLEDFPLFRCKIDRSYGFVQKPIDYRKPLAYDRCIAQNRANDKDLGPYWDSAFAGQAYGLCYNEGRPHSEAALRADARSYGAAYTRFVSKCRDSQSLLSLTLLEIGESAAMIERRLIGITRGFLALRRLDIAGALRHFGAYNAAEFKKKNASWGRIARNAGSDLSGLALELKFGWVPLIEDIGNAVEALQKPLPVNQLVSGSGSDAASVAWSDSVGFDTYANSYTFGVSHKITGHVSVSNPNLYLANRLGFVNPVSVAWQAAPLSFVIDWFLPVNKFFNLATDLVGLNIEKISVTRKSQAYADVVHNDIFGWKSTHNSSCVRFSRSLPSSLEIPTFQGLMRPDIDFGKLSSLAELAVQAITNLRR